jgi:hypothetical protein
MAAREFFPWQLATRHVMSLEPKDDKVLAKLLRQELEQRRAEYREEERALATLPPKQAEERRKLLTSKFTVSRSDGKLVSVFDLTLDDVRAGWGGLRDRLLREEWSAMCGIPTARVLADASLFCRWIASKTINASTESLNERTRTVEVSVGLNLFETEWEVLEAAVRYEIRFADGSRCWLDAVEERGLADADEVREFEDIERANDLDAQVPPTQEEIERLLRNRDNDPMGRKGLKKLAKKAGVDFPFKSKHDLQRAYDYQQRHAQHLKDRLRVATIKRAIARKDPVPPAATPSTVEDNPDPDRISVGDSLKDLDARMAAVGQQRKR